MDLDVPWVVVVPVKELHVAKTRLGDMSPELRSDLALAMAADVVAAATDAASVAEVVVVTNDGRAAAAAAALGARVVADASDSGLDDAIVDGARAARERWPLYGVAALSGDLPCATAASVEALLARATGVRRGVLADRRGDGTTALTARGESQLNPSYGAGSQSRHVLGGAEPLDGVELDRLRLDVDTPEDLRDALALGVGRHTAAVMLRAGSR